MISCFALEAVSSLNIGSLAVGRKHITLARNVDKVSRVALLASTVGGSLAVDIGLFADPVFVGLESCLAFCALVVF